MSRNTRTHIPVEHFLERKNNHPNFPLFYLLFRKLKEVVEEKGLDILIYENRYYIAFGNDRSNIISLWLKNDGVFMDSRLPHNHYLLTN